MKTLSDKIGDFDKGCIDWWTIKKDGEFIKIDDVKQFIKEIKDKIEKGLMEDLKDKPMEAFAIGNWINDTIDKLAGEKLI